MIRILSTVALVCAAIVSISTQKVSARSSAQPMARVIVQLQGSPLAADSALKREVHSTLNRFRLDPSLPAAKWYTNQLAGYQDREISYLRSQGIDLSVQYRMHAVFNGFTALVPRAQVARLQRALNVVSVTPQRKLIPLIDSSIPLVNAPAAWSALGGAPTAGRGLMIAQIDSGIDIKNPCFSDAGMPPPPFKPRSDTTQNAQYVNNKVIVARAFGSDASKHFSAKDSEGHGTFGAAIEACDYNTTTPLGTKVSGMAPDAYLMNYNVFPGDDSGNGSNDNLIPAMEAAVLDGADVINMSLGFATGQGVARLDVDEQALENAVRAGVPVVVSAGNAGPTPQTVSSPAGAPDAIAVGATTNSHAIYASVDVNGPDQVPASLAKMKAKEGSAAFETPIGPLPVVPAGYGRLPGNDSKDTSANDFAGADVKGKIALIQRGSPTGSAITFETKVLNAAKQGATAVIIYDNNPADLNPFTPSLGSGRLPTMLISNADGKALLAWIQSHPDATVTLDPTVHSYPATADDLSDFSSRGPLTNYSIRPDLVAPGQDIYSATQTQETNSDMYDPSGFTSEDGTSFSAPHVTGAVALVEQKHLKQPSWTPAAIKAVLMETADTSIYLDPSHTQVPTVQDMGAGRLDAGAAVAAQADILPQSLSFGAVNDGSGAVRQVSTLSLGDLGGGSGTWQTSVQTLHTTGGVAVSVPGSVTLASGAKTSVPVQLSVAAGTAPGNYDGFIYLTRGTQSLHVPYFVHVSNVVVKPSSILLVDDTTSRFQVTGSAPGVPPVTHLDVTNYYESALTAIGRTYTYWDEAQQGSPTVQDMKQASAVIVYTGANLNAFAGQNANYEELEGPLGPIDVQALDDYLRQGGKVFLTGMGVALSDPAWTAVVLGAEATNFSLFDTTALDPQLKGGISPPQPSVSPDLGTGAFSAVGAFAGLKPIDFSTKGNGAGDNLAVYNPAIKDMVGVAPLKSVAGNIQGYGRAYGSGALQASLKFGYQDVGIVASDEPAFNRSVAYPGRSVLFSFGFEGIDDNTGYSTRAQVMQRVMQWLQDAPTATVTGKKFRAGAKATLRAALHGSSSKTGAYQWQIGKQTLPATSKASQYVFPHAGRYRIRVLVTDGLGHRALSPWATAVVR